MRQIGSHVRSVKFLLCPTSASSKPALDFFTSSYSIVKHLNPVLPYMIRAAPGKPPLMVVEFDLGEKAHVPLAGLDTAGVERKVRVCAWAGGANAQARSLAAGALPSPPPTPPHPPPCSLLPLRAPPSPAFPAHPRANRLPSLSRRARKCPGARRSPAPPPLPRAFSPALWSSASALIALNKFLFGKN